MYHASFNLFQFQQLCEIRHMVNMKQQIDFKFNLLYISHLNSLYLAINTAAKVPFLQIRNNFELINVSLQRLKWIFYQSLLSHQINHSFLIQIVFTISVMINRYLQQEEAQLIPIFLALIFNPLIFGSYERGEGTLCWLQLNFDVFISAFFFILIIVFLVFIDGLLISYSFFVIFTIFLVVVVFKSVGTRG